MFVQSTYDLDTLVKVQIPSSAQLMQKLRLRSGSFAPARAQSSASQPLIQQSFLPPVDDLYRDKKPQVPMHRVPNYASVRDPVHKHGAQALELRALEKKGARRPECVRAFFNCSIDGGLHERHSEFRLWIVSRVALASYPSSCSLCHCLNDDSRNADYCHAVSHCGWLFIIKHLLLMPYLLLPASATY